MIWETYRHEFNRNRLKLSEVWPENLGGLHRPGIGQLRLPRPVSSPGPRACEFQSNINFKTEIYVLKPFCVYSSLLLRCFIDHNISFGKHIEMNLSEKVDVSGGRKPAETPDRLQAVQNVLATVVGLDIGAKTDYNATETRMLNRVCCHGGPSSFGKRKVSVFQYSGAFYQCHINLIWKPRSIGYRGHGII